MKDGGRRFDMARVAAVAALLLLIPGCMGGPGDASSASNRCPAWTGGQHAGHYYDGSLRPDLTNLDELEHDDVVDAPFLYDSGDPLDRVQIDFFPRSNGAPQAIMTHDAILTMTFHRTDNGAQVVVYNTSRGPPGAGNAGQLSWVFGNPNHRYANFTFLMQLAASNQVPDPAGVNVTYDVQWNVDNDPSTPSSVDLDYAAYLLYRRC
jgi:hypothetical protein